MFSMALQLHAKNVLELGVLHGESSLALLLGAFVTGGIVHGVDANPRGFSSRFRPPNLLRHHWHLHVSDALEYLRDVPANVTFDLVFLDDLHDYEHVAKEIQLLAPHLHSNSIVLVHDTMMGFDREAVGPLTSLSGTSTWLRLLRARSGRSLIWTLRISGTVGAKRSIEPTSATAGPCVRC
jgi:predicted O-methyltransferase YrrM